jgi:DNA-binding SARP family transcriptional activator
LATLLWPEATPELGLKSLGVVLSSLRKLLEPPGVPAGTVLIADRRTARLAAQAIHTDVAAFRQALQSARQAADALNRRMNLETAVSLYRGELLPGFYEDWISPERDLLTLAYRRALDELIELMETSGQPVEALSYALKHAAGDPYD